MASAWAGRVEVKRKAANRTRISALDSQIADAFRFFISGVHEPNLCSLKITRALTGISRGLPLYPIK